eukprot:6722917-Pyramimonas_sp.AAC.1
MQGGGGGSAQTTMAMERTPFCQGAALLLRRPAHAAPAPVFGHASRATPPTSSCARTTTPNWP